MTNASLAQGVTSDDTSLNNCRVMGHGICSYIGLNEIKNLSLIMNFIIISYLFKFIFRFIR